MHKAGNETIAGDKIFIRLVNAITGQLMGRIANSSISGNYKLLGKLTLNNNVGIRIIISGGMNNQNNIWARYYIRRIGNGTLYLYAEEKLVNHNSLIPEIFLVPDNDDETKCDIYVKTFQYTIQSVYFNGLFGYNADYSASQNLASNYIDNSSHPDTTTIPENAVTETNMIRVL